MTTLDGLAEWQTYTSAACQTRWFEGQHYFLLDQAVGIANEIAAFALAVTARSNSDRS
jgi:surfactin synthase thioesterase subunit